MRKPVAEFLNKTRALARTALFQRRVEPSRVGIPRRRYGTFPGTPLHGNFVYTFATACALSFVLMASGTGWAAGLGRVTPTSALGQPFEAEIELVAVKDEEKPGLRASLASQQFFRQANIDYLPLLATFRASVEVRSDGQPYVRIVSSQPVTEPLLNLLVELSWPSGRLMREYTIVLARPGGGGLMHAPQPTGTTPAVLEEFQLLPGKTQDASGWERSGFPVAKGSANEEALKQTVTGKIAPAANADRLLGKEKEAGQEALQRSKAVEPQHAGSEEGVSASVRGRGRDAGTQPTLREVDEDATGKSGFPRGDGERIASLEKDIPNTGRPLEQENPAPAEMEEQAVTLTPGKAILPLAVVPQSLTTPPALTQSETNHPEGAGQLYEAADEPVAVAKSAQAASFSVNPPEPEAGFLDLAQMTRPIIDRLMTNVDVLGGTLALLIAGVVGTSIVRRSKKADHPAGGNIISPMLDSSAGAAARVPSTVALHETHAAFSTERVAGATEARTCSDQDTRDAKTEPLSPISQETTSEDERSLKTKMKVSPLFSGSSGDASPPSKSGSPAEVPPAGIDLNKNVSSAYPYTYLRGRRLHERRSRGREMLSQLDLARAYQEMGDRNAALQVLREVIRDGDAGQRERARQILANL